MKVRRALLGSALISPCAALLALGASAAPAGPLAAGHATMSSGPALALNAFARAWTSVKGYAATVAVFERKGTQVQTFLFDYSFDKPSSMTVHMVGGTHAGVTVVWNGGTSVIAHRGSGLMGMFKKTLSLHDPQVATLRGSSFDELSFGKILAHARQTPGTLTLGPGVVIGGVATQAVTLVPANPSHDAGLTREVIEISTTTHLPMRVMGYQGRALVRKIDYSNVKLTH